MTEQLLPRSASILDVSTPADRMPGKRLFDLLLGVVLLLASLPVMVAIAVAIRLDDGGSVLFTQSRTGRHGRTFRILKFRSMVEGADAQRRMLAAAAGTDGLLFKLQDDPRVTRVGRFLRRTSLDELPQLWNVLRGDMSLVGPRPLAVEPHEFGPAENERHSVKPGITGAWQLSGRHDYLEMVRLDLHYIRHWSLWLDLRLVLRTIPILWSRPGIR